MCHQSVGLIQSIVEKSGIPTVSITILEEVTRRVVPPRALFVDYPMGYPLGEPGNSDLQKRIILQTLELLRSNDKLPKYASFDTSGNPPGRGRSSTQLSS